MRKPGRSTPLTTGTLVGMAWGLLVALLEGLPLLLQGSLAARPDLRLLALAYLATIYGGPGAIAGALLGGGTWLFLRRTRRHVGRAALAAGTSGFFAALTLALEGAYRVRPVALGWAIIVILAAISGAALGRLLVGAGRGRGRWWPILRGVVLVTFALAVAGVLAVAGFRGFLRDLPAFNPPSTDRVATAGRPDIVLITASGVRPDHLGAYGYDPEISPNIDALAAQGVCFEQAIAPASWSEPSLASLLTSLYPSELGIGCRPEISCQPQLDSDRVTLAEALQSAGYRTQAFLTSSWLSPELGFDQGFDGFESARNREPYDVRAVLGGMSLWLFACEQDTVACRLAVRAYELLFDPQIPSGYGGLDVNERVQRFLEVHGGERFFLWVHYTEALPPYNMEPAYGPLPEGDAFSPEPRLRRLGYWELGDPFTPREKLFPIDVERLTALYDGEVHGVDRLVGEVTSMLAASGLSDRTLVVFTSEHGQEFMEHGGYTYGHSLYDEVIRVPLIVAGPGITSPGQVAETPVDLLDLTPTLAEIAGASLSPEAEGRSLVPALQGQTLEKKQIFSESLYRVPYELKALRQGEFELIYRPDEDRYELYDLTTDPAEQRDLAGQGLPIADALEGELLTWMEHTRQVAHDLPRAAPPTEFKGVAW